MSDFSLILDKEKTTEQMFKVCDYYKVKNIDIAEFLDTSEVEVSMNSAWSLSIADERKARFFSFCSTFSGSPVIVI